MPAGNRASVGLARLHSHAIGGRKRKPETCLRSAASLISSRFLVFFYGHQLRVYAGVLNLQMLYFLLAWPVRQLTFLFRTIRNTTPILISSGVAAVISLSFVYPMVRSLDRKSV